MILISLSFFHFTVFYVKNVSRAVRWAIRWVGNQVGNQGSQTGNQVGIPAHLTMHTPTVASSTQESRGLRDGLRQII